MPGLDIAEQKSWQNFLDSTLRLYATLNRRLTDAHQLSLFDVRVLDILDNAPIGCARMGEVYGLISSASCPVRRSPRWGRLTDQHRAETFRPGFEDRRAGRRGLTPLPLSAVAWQSGLMHSP